MSGSSVAADGVIEREIRIAARPETVFAFWTEPVKMARWMGRTIRLAAGSRVEPPSRIVLTWGWEAPGDPTPPGASTVEVDFLADGDSTIVRLRHSGLVTEAVSGHAEGWDQFLPSLVAAAGG